MAENTILPVLKEIDPYLYERIINYVILRNIQPLPMKSIGYLYQNAYLLRMSDESIHQLPYPVCFHHFQKREV